MMEECIEFAKTNKTQYTPINIDDLQHNISGNSKYEQKVLNSVYNEIIDVAIAKRENKNVSRHHVLFTKVASAAAYIPTGWVDKQRLRQTAQKAIVDTQSERIDGDFKTIEDAIKRGQEQPKAPSNKGWDIE
jgi:hypothetical protein